MRLAPSSLGAGAGFTTCYIHEGKDAGGEMNKNVCRKGKLTRHFRSQIKVVDQPFTGNQWIPTAFRHHVGGVGLEEWDFGGPARPCVVSEEQKEKEEAEIQAEIEAVFA